MATEQSSADFGGKKRIKITIPLKFKKSNSSEMLDGDNGAKPAASAATPSAATIIRSSVESRTSSSLPSLGKLDYLSFPVNEECTALKFSPSGHLVAAGFADGTVRLFDLTGKYSKKDKRLNTALSLSKEAMNGNLGGPRQSGKMVLSKDHQTYGAVACQIHAKGVHNKMLMDVDISEDCQFCFSGVLRGSMELVAVHLGHLEESYKDPEVKTDLLDLVHVYRKADAKLRGFGACKRLTGEKDKYLLFTGKAIKNIHIWSFEPPNIPGTDPIWQQLYDTSTNGNTIKMLQFRHNRNGFLQGLSKSDGQKLRVWDLGYEESAVSGSKRPVRPPFQDVVNTETCLAVAGGFCICGGSTSNQMSIVSLDVDADNLQSKYNRTELALPGVSASNSSRRRQQRGDLKCIESVAGIVYDAGQVLLELSDQSIVQYTQNSVGLPVLKKMDVQAPPEGACRQTTVGRLGKEGLAVAAFAIYNPAVGQGSINLKVLDEDADKHRSGYWGFSGKPKLPSPLLARQESKVESYAESCDKSLSKSATETSPNDHSTEGALTNVVSTVKKADPSLYSERDQKNAPGMAMVTPKTVAETPLFGPTAKSLARQLATTTPFAKPARVSLGASSFADSVKGSPDSVTPVFRNTERISKSDKRRSQKEKSTNGTTFKKQDVGASRGHSVTKVRGNAEERKQSLVHDTSEVTKYSKANDGNKKAVVLSSTVDQSKRKVGKKLNNFDAEPSARTFVNLSTKPQGPSPPVPRKRMNRNGRCSFSEDDAEDSSRQVLNSSYEVARMEEIPISPKPAAKSPRSFRSPAARSPMLNKKDQSILRQRILDSCAKKLDEIKGLLDEIPKTSIWGRKARAASLQTDLLDRHKMARSQLADEHRAALDFLRRQILHVTRNAIFSIQDSPRVSSLDKAKVSLRDTLEGYKHKYEEMIYRQQLEASTLAAVQTRERNGDEAQLLDVSYTQFSRIFEEAMGCLPHLD